MTAAFLFLYPLLRMLYKPHWLTAEMEDEKRSPNDPSPPWIKLNHALRARSLNVNNRCQAANAPASASRLSVLIRNKPNLDSFACGSMPETGLGSPLHSQHSHFMT
jgi:hypothetical protein